MVVIPNSFTLLVALYPSGQPVRFFGLYELANSHMNHVNSPLPYPEVSINCTSFSVTCYLNTLILCCIIVLFCSFWAEFTHYSLKKNSEKVVKEVKTI